MKILYIVIGDLGRTSSGSGLRPNCMYRAFLERGHTVYVLSGNEGRSEGKARAAEVKKAKQWAEENKPDLCYIESSTYPMLHSCDYDMIRWLQKKNIPTAYFYRDFYRRFPDLFPRRAGLANRLKELYLDIMQMKTDRILHKVDVVYFPSQQCFRYFDYRKMKALPPAGQEDFIPHQKNNKTCIYAGGISEFYGFPLMMDAFHLLNSCTPQYKLILVCREAEFRKVWTEESLPQWLEVHHVSGKELVPLYEKADIGLLALTSNDYSDLAVGTKLYQYVSYGLPVVATDTKAMATIIQENHFGKVTACNAEHFASAIRSMLDDDAELQAYQNALEESVRSKNLWVHRVDQIVMDLIG